jgi:hypothetical protein
MPTGNSWPLARFQHSGGAEEDNLTPAEMETCRCAQVLAQKDRRHTWRQAVEPTELDIAMARVKRGRLETVSVKIGPDTVAFMRNLLGVSQHARAKSRVAVGILIVSGRRALPALVIGVMVGTIRRRPPRREQLALRPQPLHLKQEQGDCFDATHNHGGERARSFDRRPRRRWT